MLIVISIYLLINFVFTYTLGIGAMGTSMLVASDSASIFLGEKGAALVSIIILISLLGANNGFILTSARINYAMARDKLFFQQAAKVHPKFKSPANALVIQAMWASVLTFSGTYNQLITDGHDLAWYYTMFLHPLPPKLVDELKEKTLVLVPELNYQGQFSSILRTYGINAESITQYTGLPFKARTLVEKITEMTNARLKDAVKV